MKLEYRVLEVAEGDKQDCNYCSLDFWSKNDLKFATATHEMMALDKKTGDCVDIAYICAECKKDFDNAVLPYCELCGRLKRNRNNVNCVCNFMKNKPSKPISAETIIAQSFASRLENKIKELEKELSATKETLKVEREEITKFHETSEEWGKRQKQELLDKIKELEAEISTYKEEIKQLKEQNKQTPQIEIKPLSKRPSFPFFRKS